MTNAITNEEDITRILEASSWHMRVLQAAAELDLPDWWIGAGFLRNLVWDTLSDNEIELPSDVDLVYFDPLNISEEVDWKLDMQMKKDYQFANWEIRNQARMHYVNNFKPFTSTEDGISHWVETATCVAVKLEEGKTSYLFSYGPEDLLNLVARPTPYFQNTEMLDTFHKRVIEKKWRERWPNLKIELNQQNF